jgi:hypothetical protein
MTLPASHWLCQRVFHLQQQFLSWYRLRKQFAIQSGCLRPLNTIAGIGIAGHQ